MESRKKRILIRSSNRGMKEMDYILGTYCKAHIHNMPDDDLEEFERLLEQSDQDLFHWLLNKCNDKNTDAALSKIRSFHDI